MKTVFEIIQQRCSVRSYSDTPVELATIRALVEAARLSPSACNAQPWRFVAVTDKALIGEIARRGLGGVVPNKWAASAPVIIIGCALLNLLTHRIGKTVKGIDYHQIDLGIAMEHLVLRATELGLGTCWIGWFKEKPIKAIIRIPRSWKVVALLTLGYPLEESRGGRKRLDLRDILFFNRVVEK